jgi:hypothetical protein
LLYWFKSKNSDAEGAALIELLSLLALLVQNQFAFFNGTKGAALMELLSLLALQNHKY